MTAKKNGPAPSKNAALKNNTSAYTENTPLIGGWANLAKSSRINRRQKRGWQRGQK